MDEAFITLLLPVTLHHGRVNWANWASLAFLLNSRVQVTPRGELVGVGLRFNIFVPKCLDSGLHLLLNRFLLLLETLFLSL